VTAKAALDELNKKCTTLCEDYHRKKGPSGDSNVWSGFGGPGDCTPNYRLLYSSAATFENHGGVMFLGTNPGGDHTAADPRHHEWPFSKSCYSAYLDECWDGQPKGCHPMQEAALEVAAAIAGGREDGKRLLQRSPAGNLIPFRSERPKHLPRGLEKHGLKIGWELISRAKPRVLVLFTSNKERWGWLMKKLDWGLDPDLEKSFRPNWKYRESKSSGSWPRFVFALPALNNKRNPAVEKIVEHFENRVDDIGHDRLCGSAAPA